jgi:hypothetical protein
VLVWDSLQFLSAPPLLTVVTKLNRVLRPGASLLAMFHTEERIDTIPDICVPHSRPPHVQMTALTQRKPAQVFTNRSLEKMFLFPDARP